MGSEIARRVAEVILEDRDGVGTWRDAERLSHYLLGSYAPGSMLLKPARAVAESILADLESEGSLSDADALAAFIEREMGRIREQA